MALADPTRTDDERVLSWLHYAKQGWSSSQIARQCGRSSPYLRTLFGRIRSDDLALSGEPREVVLAGYPWTVAK